ncbi:MAG TPA: lipocalin-like domain-containing protein [Herpetosiphonaceae bacterium]|nr:lipocalin-like domain-containing protein [Herpetosiphonaceae bacterium]
MREHSLVGTWRLVAWENRDTQGRVTWPAGHDAREHLIYTAYTADGYMSVQIMTANRPPFAAGDLLGGKQQTAHLIWEHVSSVDSAW